jgi:hypothetical protein
MAGRHESDTRLDMSIGDNMYLSALLSAVIAVSPPSGRLCA